ETLDVVELKRRAHGGRSLLHLVEHVGKRRLERECLFDLISAYVGILAIFQEARKLMLAKKLGNRGQVRPPVLRPSFQVCENRGDASLVENRECVLDVFIEIGVKDALIHEVQPRTNVEQDPAEVMKLEGCENGRVSLHRLLDTPIVANRLFLARLDLS